MKQKTLYFNMEQTLQNEEGSFDNEMAFQQRIKQIIKVTGSDELQEFANQQLPLTKKIWERMTKKLGEIFIKLGDQNKLVECLKQTGMMLEKVISNVMDNKQDRLRLNFLLSVVLQYTDHLNLTILNFYTENLDSMNPMIDLQNHKTRSDSLRIIFRLFEAQPYFRKLWDNSPLFSEMKLDEMDKIVQGYVRSMVYHSEAMADVSLEACNWIDKNLRVSKQSLHEINLDLIYLEKTKQNNVIFDDGLVGTPYLLEKADEAINQMQTNVFKHFVIIGDEGCGKMSLVRLLKDKTENRNFIVVTLEETFDSKNLVGTYVCNETGEFVFKKGPLTVAAEQGLWLILRNISQAPPDLLTFLLPLVQENKLQVTSTFSITPKLGFRIMALCHQGRDLSSISPFLAMLHQVQLEPLGQRDDLIEILRTKYPRVHLIEWLAQFLIQAASNLQIQLNKFKGQMLDHKQFSIKQLFKSFSRVENSLFSVVDLSSGESSFISSQLSLNIILEVIDTYLAHIYDKRIKASVILSLVTEVYNPICDSAPLDASMVLDYVQDHSRSFGINQESYYFGRSKPIEILSQQEKDENFVYTASTLRVMEQICISLQMQESVLLVGETGTGKTTSVQELAKLQGKKLHVFNMNQNTDSSDLLGGFKPVDVKFLLKPVYEHFLQVFRKLFKSGKNQKFLDLTQQCYEQNQVKEFIQCLTHGLTSIKNKKGSSDEESNKLERQIQDLQKRSQKLESGGGFIFQFIEGTLIKSIQDGEWILLDEINLASDSVLNRLATLIEGDHILLNERADIVETKRHKDFRIFMCMNPPYTSAGKKQLPPSLRGKMTEIYVPELESHTDLWPIVDRNAPSTMFSEHQKRMILEFYMKARIEAVNNQKRSNIGLRNLSRSLKMMRQAVTLKYPVVKAIYDALFTCFASHLDSSLQQTLHNLIYKLFDITTMPFLDMTRKQGPQDNYAYVEEFIIPKGDHPPLNFKENDFILTNTFKHLVKRLASIVAVTDYAVILEGPTSAGKTSTVQYLANVTHNKVIRINNHMHTDIQEYLGSYVPSTNDQDGKLVFQEGVLVEAVRNGYWVILDELNLAPSEVLEALNRLLDDNRELQIVETQKMIKAHPNFRIFATQNPTEGYGGRKELSEAFKNRFILMKVGDVPTDELQEILINKCGLPKSRAVLMVKTMENLQIYRSQGNLFSGKDSTITVRDLLKWAYRVSEDEKGMASQDIALEGYLVLGERSRNPQDKLFIKQTIETTLKCKINEDDFYQSYFKKHGLENAFDSLPSSLGIPKLVISKQLKRLAVLVHKCLIAKEPILLVGETGCGKTTLCQVFAALNKQQLYSINCHQNTETSDFIGCMRTRKNLQQSQDALEVAIKEALSIIDKEEISQISSIKKQCEMVLKELKGNNENKELYKKIKKLKSDLNMVFEWHDGILVEAMQTGGLLLIDEISLANDSVLERLNSVFEQERMLILSEKSSTEAIKIVGQEGFSIVATMNPSGDFGKKELSPALRNRMTEIWVESYFLQRELMDLYSSTETKIHQEISLDVDLYIIILKMSQDKLSLSPPEINQVSLTLFNMIGYINFTLAYKYSVLERKALSVRDVINCIDFISVSLPLFKDVSMAIYHSIQLVIMDGLCLGIDVAGDKQKEQIQMHCNAYIQMIMSNICNKHWKMPTEGEFVQSQSQIGVKPFLLDRREKAMESTFAFDALTTRSNLHRVLRAYQLQKPILIEGPPGVGKTSLIENLARLSGRTLTRVNLSEQTDMMDLLGSEYPSLSEKEGDDDDIQFRWCDGVLLRAIKEGHWFLIDEMNLAQQSVLEGLNAILDHRRTVYIPELNKEFECHPDFYVFACQNPSQSSSSVGGRKTLPKSFMNRFNKIYLEELTQEDYNCILNRQISSDAQLAHLNVPNLLKFSQEVEKQKDRREETQVNLRDLMRLFKLYKRFLIETNDRDLSLMHCVDICYLQNASKDKIVNQVLAKSQLFNNFESVKEALQANTLVRIIQQGQLQFQSPKSTTIGCGKLDLENSDLYLKDILNMQGNHTKALQFLTDCLQTNFPLLIVADNCDRFVRDLQTISRLANKSLNRILLNDRSDTTQLLGCFEQTSRDLSQLEFEIVNCLKESHTKEVISLQFNLKQSQNLDHQIHIIQEFLNANQLKKWQKSLDQMKKVISKGQSRFEWVDSVLVRAISQGEWVVFENSNLCNPSILDRLNSLLEEGNHSLSINEQGLVQGNNLREVVAHEDFRPIFLMSKKTLVDQGKDVSRALRNRCLLIDIDYECKQDETLNNDVAQAADQIFEYVQRQDSRVINVYHESLKFDFYPCQDTCQKVNEDQEQKIVLGKRNKPDQTLDLLPSSEAFSESYIFKYLSLHKTPQNIVDLYCNLNISIDPEINWVQSYLSYKTNQLAQNIQEQVLSKQSKIVLTNTSQKILNGVLKHECSDLRTLQDKLLLLEYLNDNLGKADVIQSHNVIFMLAKLHGDVPSRVLHSLENLHGPVIMRALRASANLSSRVSLIENLHPNIFDEEDLSKIMKLREAKEDMKQSALGGLWINSVNGSQNPQNGYQALSSHYSIIALNDDKDLLGDVDPEDLSDMLQESSPFLILIAKSADSIMMSASSMYQCFCFFKDVKKLLKQTLSHNFDQKRLNNLYPMSLCHNFVQNLNLLNIERMYGLKKCMEVATIDRILCDEDRHLSLRDLPSFYANANGLLNQMKKQLGEQMQGKMLHEAYLYGAKVEVSEQAEEIQEKLKAKSNGSLIAEKSIKAIVGCVSLLNGQNTLDIIESMIVLPFEHSRLEKIKNLEYKEQYMGELKFWLYHRRDIKTSLQQMQPIMDQITLLQSQVDHLSELIPPPDIHKKLHGLLTFAANLIDIVNEIARDLSQSKQLVQMLTKCEMLNQLLIKGQDLYFANFNNIIEPMMVSSLHFVVAVRNYLYEMIREEIDPKVTDLIIGLDSDESYQKESTAWGKSIAGQNSQNQLIYENQMIWTLKFQRFCHLNQDDTNQVKVHALDHFIHREISKKLAQEQEMDDAEAKIYNLPFTMKMQSLMDNNKAMDEMTAKDKEQREKEAQQEIEVNFPSYFDEFQKQLLALTYERNENMQRDFYQSSHIEVQHHEVRIQDILGELTELHAKEDDSFRTDFLRLRLEIVQMCQEKNNNYKDIKVAELLKSFTERDNLWMEDAICCLEDQIKHAQMKSVMNISELKLPSTYNFYHDSIPTEARLIFQPLAQLQSRVRDIIQEFESPILNDVLFISNYMMVSFNTKSTPLMKMLTGMELLLEKLDEWQGYASKKLNSCHEEINVLKQLIIRYRKIQILSWRNLLNHRRVKMVKEDFQNCIRFIHTIERQIFDVKLYNNKRAANSSKNLVNKDKVELTIFELVDMFVRDSSLGLYESRLSVVQLLYDSLILKHRLLTTKQKDSLVQMPDFTPTQSSLVSERLRKVINILHFVLGYYSQFTGKLQRTIARLDASAREKIKTLIDVSKWTVQKFTQVKSNIDKTHRQLNRSCKQEEEILMQNIQTLVLTSSRKKYINTDAGGDKLISLDNEKMQILGDVGGLIQIKRAQVQQQETVIKQLEFFEKKQIEQKWPDANALESVMQGLFERLKTVRDIDKKHFQRRAFIDLLKFMKDSGLKPNFQDKLQPYIMDSRLVNTGDQKIQDRLVKYFYKAQELLIIMESSSQVDENSDLKNADVIRVQGFSQSLMHRILEINHQLAKLETIRDKFNSCLKNAPVLEKDEIQITPSRLRQFDELKAEFARFKKNVVEKLNVAIVLEGKSPIRNEEDSIQSLSSKTYQELKDKIQIFTTTLNSQDTSSRRINRLASHSLNLLSSFSLKVDNFLNSSEQIEQPNEVISKRSKLLLKYIQLLYQDVFKHVKDYNEQEDEKKQESSRKESFDKSTVLSDPNIPVQEGEDLYTDLSITEQQEFTKKLVEKLEGQDSQPILEKIHNLSNKLFTFEGMDSSLSLSAQDLDSLSFSRLLLLKVTSLLDFISYSQSTFLVSLTKFSYLTQRVFLYLIYQGFCGKDDQQEDQKEREADEQYLDGDGCGMGDGQGQNNVSNEIENEEQLEGLKNYESEEEQQQQNEDNKDQNEEDKNNDFEMKEDFEGDLEDKEQKEDQEEDNKDDENEDDALDKVDDMLDNQLWNKNMEDMEQKEDENGENDDDKEKEEIDLGDREMDKQNQMDQKEKEMAAGDHDKQDEEKSQEEGANDDEMEEVNRDDEEQQDDKQDDLDEMSNKNDVPLDRDELIEDDERKSDDQSEKAQDDEEMADEEAKSEENPEDDVSNKSDGEEDLEQKPEEFDEKNHQDDDEASDQQDQSVDPDQVGDNNMMDGESNKDDGEENPEADLKKGENNLNEQENQQNQNQQQNQAEQEMQTQFDVDGSDILFQLAQKIQEKQQKKEQTKHENKKQEKLDENKKQIEDPKINPDEPKEPSPQDPNNADDGEAMEYEFDENAEQLQGKLAAEDAEEMPDVDQENKTGQHEDEQKQDQEIEDLDDQVQKTKDQQTSSAAQKEAKDFKKKESQVQEQEDSNEEMESIEDIKDLVDDYQQFLDRKKQQLLEDDHKMEVDTQPQIELETLDTYDEFDYMQEKINNRELYDLWRDNEEICQKSIELLSRFKSQTGAASASLCEQLRIVLEPQLSQQLQGDYRTGKRLNMKKVISFIASHYRNDKIWLRRTMPSKRDYKILIAIDDSLSMNEQNLGFFSLEAMVTLVEALNRLEVGKVAVARIRDRMELLQSFEDSYSNERSAFIVSQFEFKHCAKRSHDYAMSNFVKDSNKLLDVQNTASQSGGSTSCPFVIILSDGRFNKNNIRKYMQEAQEKRYLYIFVILDVVKDQKSGILNLRSAVKQEGQGIKLVPYLKDFPFSYYCIVKDLQALPSALGSILVQWFSMMQGN